MFGMMEHEKLYRAAKQRHGQLNKDVVHDMYCKFGSELPSPAYVRTCIEHAKPEPVQSIIELTEGFFTYQDTEDPEFEETLRILSKAVNRVRDKYELEVDTFLACHVNSDYKSFGEYSGIARSVLEKICKFARYEILREYKRIRKGNV